MNMKKEDAIYLWEKIIGGIDEEEESNFNAVENVVMAYIGNGFTGKEDIMQYLIDYYWEVIKAGRPYTKDQWGEEWFIDHSIWYVKNHYGVDIDDMTFDMAEDIFDLVWGQMTAEEDSNIIPLISYYLCCNTNECYEGMVRGYFFEIREIPDTQERIEDPYYMARVNRLFTFGK